MSADNQPGKKGDITVQDIVESAERAKERAKHPTAENASPASVLGVKLGAERRKAGKTVDERAAELGVDRGSVVDLELGNL